MYSRYWESLEIIKTLRRSVFNRELQIVSLLTDIFREHFHNAKQKALILPALGELLFMAAVQVSRSQDYVCDNE